MSSRFDAIVRGGTLVLPTGEVVGDIGIQGGTIAEIGDLSRAQCPKENEINAVGLHVLPGMFDAQVHFREPGLTHKEDFVTGTTAALLGGITSVFEMPNTNPSTTTPEALKAKCERVPGRARVNMGFYFGGSHENLDHITEWERLPGAVGIKTFMGSSTGTLLMDKEEDLKRLLETGSRRVTLHAEDNARLSERKAQIPRGATAAYHPIWRDEETARLATERAIRHARAAKRPVHILHVSTADEVELLAQARDIASFETLPQFLLFDYPEAYERLGTLVQMNPPVRGGRHKEALRKAVQQGLVDIIGSDHAPHTLEEKALPFPQSPSGMPGVQTILPLMLNFVNEGLITLPRLVQLMAGNPTRLFQVKRKGAIVKGFDADLTLVDLGKVQTIQNANMATKVRWTPFDGMKVKGWPVHTLINGQVALQDGAIYGVPLGRVLEFDA